MDRLAEWKYVGRNDYIVASGIAGKQGRAKILTRIDRLQEGNPGNSRSVGAGIHEMKIDFGPGYRVYFVQRGEVLIVLLCGGDKDSQQKDIGEARILAADLSFED